MKKVLRALRCCLFHDHGRLIYKIIDGCGVAGCEFHPPEKKLVKECLVCGRLSGPLGGD